MLSQTVEYSLRAVLLLASRHNQALTVKEIAEQTKVPAPYLSKTMKGLVRAGIVQSRRGLGGGFKLVTNPDQITIWDIVQAIDPIKRIRSCPLGIEGHDALCPLHRRIDEAIESIEKAFRSSSLADLLQEWPEVSPLCVPSPIVQITLAQKSAGEDKRSE
jgi:Rrf2 family transcriptional regulator, nitric oxide-sensitive transcriptional repressor